MMKPTNSLSVASLLFFARNLVRADDSCAGSIDNTANADDLIQQAVIVTGDYIITNIGTGATLTYVHNDQANFYVTTSSLSAIVEELAGASGTAASNVITFTDNEDEYSSIRMAQADALKCMSAQWNFETDCDGYGVAYSCSIGPDAVSSTLETTKQRWLMIPCDDPTSSSSVSDAVVEADVTDSTSSAPASTYTGCPKTATWLEAHIDDIQYGYLDRHPACSALIDTSSSKMKRKYKRSQNVSKRGDDYSGTYCIVAVDHITDMVTKALSGQQASAFADAASSLMVAYNNTDPNQVWQITLSS